MQLHATVFDIRGGWQVWLKFMILMSLGVMIALFTALTLSRDEVQNESGSIGWRASLTSTSTLLNTLLLFFLGFHVSDLKSRLAQHSLTSASLRSSLNPRPLPPPPTVPNLQLHGRQGGRDKPGQPD